MTPLHHWAVAFVSAVILHICLAIYVIGVSPTVGAQDYGIGGIEFSLGPAGAPPGASKDGQEQAADTEQKGDPTAEQETEETPIPEEINDTEITENIEQNEEEINPPEAVEITETENISEIEEIEVVKVEKLNHTEIQENKLDDQSNKQTNIQTSNKVTRTFGTLSGQQKDQMTMQGSGTAGSKNGLGKGDGDGTQGGGTPGVLVDYATTLQIWIEKHKIYPFRARAKRQEGVVLLYFMINQNGKVLDYRIEKSSDYNLLDQEAIATLERAEPFPPFTSNMQQNQLELIVPIQFFLK